MARILVVDDTPTNLKLLADLLRSVGFDIATATSGEDALEKVAAAPPDLILLDVLMPGMDGFEVCRRVRARDETEVVPVIMVTALEPKEERVKGLEAGADDFLTKPIHRPELLARVRSLLRIKELVDTVKAQAEELEALNKHLEERVQEQVSEIESLNRLRRFLPHQVAELVMSSGGESFLESHRQEIATVFCDLRSFTAFSEMVEPEETFKLLREYHEALGTVISKFEATVDHRAGDGMMVFLNDPIPCCRPAKRAVELAVAMRESVSALIAGWKKLGHDLGFGVGVSVGYATVGLVGFEAHYDYVATGRGVILASRLCDEAGNGQILVSQKVMGEIENEVRADFVADLTVKGFSRPVPTFNVIELL